MAGTDVVQLGQQLGLALSSAGDLRYCISWSIVGVPQQFRKSVSSVMATECWAVFRGQRLCKL